MVTCGISDSFESLSPTSGQITYVLLSRSPLAFPLAGIGSSDLHVLCTPPAFVLSQDQTLRQKIRPPFRAVHLSFEFDQKINETAWRSCHSSAVKDRAPTSQWNSAYGRDAESHHTHPRLASSISVRVSSATFGLFSGFGSLSADMEEAHDSAFRIAQRLEHEIGLSLAARAVQVGPFHDRIARRARDPVA